MTDIVRRPSVSGSQLQLAPRAARIPSYGHEKCPKHKNLDNTPVGFRSGDSPVIRLELAGSTAKVKRHGSGILQREKFV